ncbi:MAG: hypothetical protein ACP5E3_05525 [Bacteroidales bacterium]
MNDEVELSSEHFSPWLALCNKLNRNGSLGYVQQEPGSPYPFYENQPHVYATGAFLLAGKEMHSLVKG